MTAWDRLTEHPPMTARDRLTEHPPMTALMPGRGGRAPA